MKQEAFFTLTIDDREVKATSGERILDVARREGILIPHLCSLGEGEHPFGACRVCLVEVIRREKKSVVAACAEPVTAGLQVYTGTENILFLRRMAFELIMSDHEIACGTCGRKGRCELTRLAAILKVKLKPVRLRSVVRGLTRDESHHSLTYDPGKCIKCGRCVLTCERMGQSLLTFAGRGFETMVSTFAGQPLGAGACEYPEACIAVCPTGALIRKL
jgi:NADH dehydrogenase/NADH:ubiquinone oxidoreductase subunit G